MYIDKKEVLRYLAYRGKKPDDTVSGLIDECIDVCGALARPLYVYGCYDIDRNDKGIAACGTNIVLRGKNIAKHLEGCDRCIIMAATIGNGVDNEIRITESSDMVKAVILDACATACIEELCDIICREIAEEYARERVVITKRFSPGYGDLPLDVQSSILSALSAQKRIGLTLTPNDIMLPRKSVTAIMGIKPMGCSKASQDRTCNGCNIESCPYKREKQD